MSKKKGSADDFSSILGDIKQEAPEPQKVEVVEEPKASERQLLGKVKSTTNDTQTTIYYPSAWKRRLKEQALHEDTTVNTLMLEGIRLMFAKRGITLE